jgi:hypothetical protein
MSEGLYLGFLVGCVVWFIFCTAWDLALIYLAKHDQCPYCKDENKSCFRE